MGTVEKTAGGLKPRRIIKGGPCGLIITTTRVRLHPENETRLLTLPVDDTRAQTERVIGSLAEAAAGGGERSKPDFGRWHALSDWLEAGERRVVIPYASRLARGTPAVSVRQRRDFAKLLTLVKAHALLHRASREHNSAGCVVATLEDYTVVRALVVDLFGQAAGTEVSVTVRETVDAVAKLVATKSGGPDEEATVTVREVATALDLDKSAASRRVRNATQEGYLQNLESRKGRASKLVLGEPLPECLELLPAPELLNELEDANCQIEDDSAQRIPF